MNRRRGFTLVELLTVMAIIAILAAVFLPVVRSVRGAAYQTLASRSIGQLGQAVNMYMADSDDMYPCAMYTYGDGLWQTWFGRMNPDGTIDPTQGTLRPYVKGKLKDSTAQGLPYLGDGSGFGYNWGYLGSDFNIRLDFSEFPNCLRPSVGSEVTNPARTVVFATSAYYYAPWTGGDGRTYDFGYVDPPRFWYDNPNAHFPHREPKIVEIERKRVKPRGFALFVFADGNVRALTPERVNDAMFERVQAER